MSKKRYLKRSLLNIANGRKGRIYRKLYYKVLRITFRTKKGDQNKNLEVWTQCRYGPDKIKKQKW